MVRSMYSGVAGMKAQQSAMDVIGNNIANVRTYGFKSSRATFKDVYYQKLSSGSSATGSRGGTNATQIGYGAQLSTVDLDQSQSSFTMTGRSMDMAIAGEGFFQVQDSDGNIFYTRSGQLSFDSAGNLVDSMGNFVLGVSGDPLGKSPASEKIQLAIPSVNPTSASVIETINNVKLTIKASNNTTSGNVSFNFQTDGELPGGLKVKTELTNGGTGITVKLNPTATFASLSELESEINKAITEANGGKEHPAGAFSLSMDPGDKFPAGGLTGAEIISKDYAAIPGKFDKNFPDGVFGGMKIDSASSNFSVAGAIDAAPTMEFAAGPPALWKMSMTINGKTFTGEINENMTASGKFILKTGDDADGYVTMTHPGYTALNNAYHAEAATGGSGAPADGQPWNTTKPDTDFTGINFTAAYPSKNLGFGSKVMKLSGGTEGGPQGIENLESIMVGADGVIIAKHGVHGEIPVGRIDIVTFANPQGLEQSGNTYFSSSANSGEINFCQPGTNGSGSIATGSLEQSNVDLSQEFSDMITTQRAYQANSRLITVSDTMLEELVNLKR